MSFSACSASTSGFSFSLAGGLSATPCLRGMTWTWRWKHDLAAGAFVELLHGDAVGAEYFDRGLGDPLRDLDHMREVVGLDVEDIARGRLRQNQRMAGCARHDVEEGEAPCRPHRLCSSAGRRAKSCAKMIVRVVARHRALHPNNLSQRTEFAVKTLPRQSDPCGTGRRRSVPRRPPPHTSARA